MRPIVLLLPLLLLSYSPAPAQDLRPASLDSLREAATRSRAKGAEGAPVTIIELSDFQCPFCREFALTTLAALDSAYVQTGKARLVFHNYPLPSHPAAWAAAEAALCAGAQGSFWPMHDRLFAQQAEWSRAERPAEHFERYAAELGLEPTGYRACIQEDVMASVLVGDLLQVGGMSVGTPTFILIGPPAEEGGRGTQRILTGARPLADFQQAIEELTGKR